jgi:hypothetical protein
LSCSLLKNSLPGYIAKNSGPNGSDSNAVEHHANTDAAALFDDFSVSQYQVRLKNKVLTVTLLNYKFVKIVHVLTASCSITKQKPTVSSND